VLSIFRQRESEMPILLPAFWCDAEPAFCGEIEYAANIALDHMAVMDENERPVEVQLTKN
jgi:hypothetical protein